MGGRNNLELTLTLFTHEGYLEFTLNVNLPYDPLPLGSRGLLKKLNLVRKCV